MEDLHYLETHKTHIILPPGQQMKVRTLPSRFQTDSGRIIAQIRMKRYMPDRRSDRRAGIIKHRVYKAWTPWSWRHSARCLEDPDIHGWGDPINKERRRMTKINCTFARFKAWSGGDPVYVCRNSGSISHDQDTSEAICMGCMDRIPLQLRLPAIIRKGNADKQLTINEWAGDEEIA